MRALWPVALPFFLAASALAQSPLSTLFASDNGGTQGGAIYFDLTAGAQGIEIGSLDLNFSEAVGTAAGVTVYLRPGTALGNETATDWVPVSQDDGTAVSAGDDNPTPITLLTPFCVPANTTVGVALVAASTVGHDYTGRTGQACVNNCVYATNDLTLQGGTASNIPFAGTIFNPRMVNCNLYYTVSGCVQTFPPGLVGVAETTLGTGVMTNQGGAFSVGDHLRWNFTDPQNTYLGRAATVVVNVGSGGPPAIGVSTIMPGFQQLWGGSNPPGTADLFGPAFVGAGDFSVQVPPGLFAAGDTVRIQGLVIFPIAGGPGRVPVVPTFDTVLFTYR